MIIFVMDKLINQTKNKTDMEKYNYEDAVKADIIDYIKSNYTTIELREKLENRDEFEQELNDILFTEDSVTGNASGSYTLDTWKAEENICHNMDLLQDACDTFDCEPHLDDAEWCDVTIRCYLLGQCLTEALDELESK